jgi:hypothetical protein
MAYITRKQRLENLKEKVRKQYQHREGVSDVYNPDTWNDKPKAVFRCEICDRDMPASRSSKVCAECADGLSKFGYNPDRMTKALEWMKRNKV